jgi:hypothetical protein
MTSAQCCGTFSRRSRIAHRRRSVRHQRLSEPSTPVLRCGPPQNSLRHMSVLGRARMFFGGIDPKNLGPLQPAPVSPLEWPQGPKPAV